MKPYIGDSGVLVPTMHVGCSGIVVENDEVIVYVLVPTIHVGCSKATVVQYSPQEF